MQVIYLIQHAETKEIYIGCTSHLERRLKEHNAGEQKATRRKTGEWILIYAEAYRDKRDAVRRELRLKDHGRAKQELLKRAEKSLLV